MKDDVLSAVVEIEKEIAQNLAREKKKAEEYLAELRLNLEKERVNEEERLQSSLDQSVSEVKKDARIRAAKIVAHAEAHSQAVAHISDDTLKKIAATHLFRILP